MDVQPSSQVLSSPSPRLAVAMYGTLHAKRVTLLPKDLALVRRIQQSNLRCIAFK